MALKSSRWALESNDSTISQPPASGTANTGTTPEPQNQTSYNKDTTMDMGDDGFAQTRAPDDLFDDDFTPISATEATSPAPPASQTSSPAPSGKGRGDSNRPQRARGGFSRRGYPANHGQFPNANRRQDVNKSSSTGRYGSNKPASTPNTPVKPASPTSIPDRPKETSPSDTASPVHAAPSSSPSSGAPEKYEAASSDAQTSEKPAPSTATGKPPPTGPAKDSIAAVRGDRSSTGGVRAPRLTEEQLNAKFEAMRIKNAALTARHEAMQADQEAAAARDREDAARRNIRRKENAEKREKERKDQAEKRVRERKDREELMGEREANRQRKLRGGAAREWDRGKEEQDEGPARAAASPPRGTGRGGTLRGRGGFEGRGRDRGRGRGDARDAIPTKTDKKQPALDQSDFPSLPPSAAIDEKDEAPRKEMTFPAQTAKALAQAKGGQKEADLSARQEEDPKGEKKAWADMVEE